MGALKHRAVQFGIYEVDLEDGEVRKGGLRIKVQQQPFKVLQALLEHPGELVTREQLHARIWPGASYGDFDQAVNVAVAKLRTALGDSADNPRFIETLPRRGYRFLAPVRGAGLYTEASPSAAEVDKQPDTAGPRAVSSRLLLRVGAVIIAALVLYSAYFLRRAGPEGQPKQNRIMLAVLPFENLSRDPEQEYFTD